MLHRLLSYRATKPPIDMLTPLKSVLNMCVGVYGPKSDTREAIKLPVEMFIP